MISQLRASILAAILIFLAVPAQATTTSSYLRNREGVREFNKKSYFPAYQKFMKALEDDPLNPRVQLNLARTFEANEDYEKAEQAYRGALHVIPEDSPMRFEALFNWAGTLAKLKRIDDALGAYQAALALNPDSVDVKTNIELLWQGGGGGGGGDSKEKKEGEGEGKGDPSEGQQQQPKKPPKFESQELSPADVKRILDEIKNQEQNIRAQENDKSAKEMPKAKDW